jgi:hypothetical protein
VNLPRAWLIFSQAKQFNRAPSDILRIEDDYVAYCLDEAIWWFGTYVESEVAAAQKSRGKKDNERKQQVRAENRFREIMGQAPKFATTTADNG